jgi:Protein of unknown function (DUF2510)/SmpA / OmlA family
MPRRQTSYELSGSKPTTKPGCWLSKRKRCVLLITVFYSSQMQQTPPGWYPDPQQPGTQRYWDGQQWTQQTAPGGPQAPKKGGGSLVLKIMLGILLAGIVLIGGCALLVGGAVNEAGKAIEEENNKSAITQTQFDQVQIGDTKSDVTKALGQPSTSSSSQAEDMNLDCVYYNVKGGGLLDSYQLCFDTSGKLESKDKY